jgi:hypothetical protein
VRTSISSYGGDRQHAEAREAVPEAGDRNERASAGRERPEPVRQLPTEVVRRRFPGDEEQVADRLAKAHERPCVVG